MKVVSNFKEGRREGREEERDQEQVGQKRSERKRERLNLQLKPVAYCRPSWALHLSDLDLAVFLPLSSP